MNLDQLKDKAEDLIRTGRRAEARDLLLTLKGKKFNRSKIGTFGNLARRCGLATFGLQLMNPIIRPKVLSAEPASSEEKATYALLLLAIGATSEALELLQSSDQTNAEVRLATAFTHINRWDYSAAIPYLSSYLESDATPYQKMISKVNLAAAYVALGDAEKGTSLLSEILITTAQQNWNLLHRNGLELSAQVAIQEHDWARADQLLSDASSGNDELALDKLFVQKWKAIAALQHRSKSNEAMRDLMSVRAQAVASNHWETVRDCDFRKAIATGDQGLLSYVYFGTPHIQFRERLKKEVASWFKFPDEYVWQINAVASQRIFDLRNAEENEKDCSLKPGKALHLAIQVLTSDFYRPFLIGSLHSGVFPGEFYNSISSPRRISFLTHRLREWFKKAEIPLQIEVTSFGYQLQSTGPYAFRLYQDYDQDDTNSPLHYLRMLDKIKIRWANSPFSATEISEYLEISVRSARYLATWGVENEKLNKVGNGRATKYQFVF